MKYLSLLLTDTHLMPATVEINRSIFKQAIDICIEKKIRSIYHLGDLFDSRAAQSQEMLMVLDELLTMVSDAGLQMILIPGNHDKTDYESEDSFLHIYRYHPAIRVVSDYWCEGKNNNEDYPDDLLVFFAPYFNERSGVYREKLQPHITAAGVKGKKSILLTHIGVDDAVMNSGIVIENSLDSGLFDSFDKVYIGHFHDYQELKKGKIVYISSAYQENFGEDSKKGFQLLLSDGSLEFVKSTFPEFKKVVVDVNSLTKDKILELKKEYGNSDDHIRFVFKGDKEKISTLDKSEYRSLGIDVKTEEFDTKVLDYSLEEAVTFNDESISKEWLEFTEDKPEMFEIGTKYFQK